MNSKKIWAGIFAGAALTVLSACLMPVGDGDGLNKSGDIPPPVLTLEDVRPAFNRAGCSGCHQGSNPPAGLLLNNFENLKASFYIITATDTTPRFATTFPSEKRIVPRNPDSSHVYKRIMSSDPGFQMPPSGNRMGDEDKELIRQWIEQGALIVAPSI
jgi:hypothetical protein